MCRLSYGGRYEKFLNNHYLMLNFISHHAVSECTIN